MWAQMAAMGLSILGGINQYRLAKAQHKAQTIIDDANYAASETIRRADNEQGRAQGGLKNWMTSVSNQRMIESAGSQYNALGENIARQLDQAATGSLQRRIQASEQIGALTAQAAAAGVGGSTSALINGTLRLRNAMVNHEIEKQQGQVTYDMLAQRAGIMSNVYDSWDYTRVVDTANHMADIKPIRVAPDGTNAMLRILASTASRVSQVDWGSLFSTAGGSTQIENGSIPASSADDVTPGRYTFFGLRPRGSLLIK